MSLRSRVGFGTISHRRLAPRRHAFRYRTYQVLLDLDELHQLDRRVRWFSYNRAGVTSFHDVDHLGPAKRPLRDKLDAWLRERGAGPAPGRVLLLTNLRVLGYVFNPVSYFYCLDDDSLRCVVAEVNNTFGDSFAYLLDDLELAGGVYRAEARKRLYVSPFIDMEDIRYQWKLTPPSSTTVVHIDESHQHRKFFEATLRLDLRPLTTRSLGYALVRHPLTPLHTMARIHWQALHLWRKRLRFHRRPLPPRHGYPEA